MSRRRSLVAILESENTSLREQNKQLVEILGRYAPAVRIAALRESLAERPTPAGFPEVVEDAIKARAFTRSAERSCREFAGMMVAQGMRPDEIAVKIRQGPIAQASVEETLGGVVS